MKEVLGKTLDEVEMNELLLLAIEKQASDVHLAVGRPPVFRIHGEMIDQCEEIFLPKHATRLIESTMNDRIKVMYKEDWEVDYSHSLTRIDPVEGEVQHRFRVNAFTQKGAPSCVMRLIPTKIPTLDSLNLPPVLSSFVDLPRGLVLVTGPTGSGKSTTLAAIIDGINRTRKTHIITMEDPIEFVHEHKKSVIVQREIGQDSHTFARALKSALRQDPDVILLGEMRDLETIGMAVTLAETGHLVFATLHTTSASQTVDRIIDVFPAEQQEQIRVQLSNTLEAIVSQTLLKNKLKNGRVAATEILIMNSAARANVRNGKSNALNDVMQTNGKIGMHTLEQDLIKKIRENRIDIETAFKASSRPDILSQMLERMGIKH